MQDNREKVLVGRSVGENGVEERANCIPIFLFLFFAFSDRIPVLLGHMDFLLNLHFPASLAAR